MEGLGRQICRLPKTPQRDSPEFPPRVMQFYSKMHREAAHRFPLISLFSALEGLQRKLLRNVPPKVFSLVVEVH